MTEKKRIRIACPDCRAEIVVDAATGAVLSHRPSQAKGPEKDFDALFADLDQKKARAEEIFEQERESMRHRDRLLSEKFEEAFREAEEKGFEGRPEHPLDFD